jgi:hypothetical protein
MTTKDTLIPIITNGISQFFLSHLNNNECITLGIVTNQYSCGTSMLYCSIIFFLHYLYVHNMVAFHLLEQPSRYGIDMCCCLCRRSMSTCALNLTISYFITIVATLDYIGKYFYICQNGSYEYNKDIFQ